MLLFADGLMMAKSKALRAVGGRGSSVKNLHAASSGEESDRAAQRPCMI